MPKIESVVALVRAIGTKDHALMRRIVEQMIAHERSGNKTGSAEKLEFALRCWPNVLQMVELPHSIQNLVWPEANTRRMSDMELDDEIVSGIDQFLRERRNYDVIHSSFSGGNGEFLA